MLFTAKAQGQDAKDAKGTQRPLRPRLCVSAVKCIPAHCNDLTSVKTIVTFVFPMFSTIMFTNIV